MLSGRLPVPQAVQDHRPSAEQFLVSALAAAARRSFNGNVEGRYGRVPLIGAGDKHRRFTHVNEYPSTPALRSRRSVRTHPGGARRPGVGETVQRFHHQPASAAHDQPRAAIRRVRQTAHLER